MSFFSHVKCNKKQGHIECTNTRDDNISFILKNFKSDQQNQNSPLYKSIMISGSKDYLNPTRTLSNGTFYNIKVEEISITFTNLIKIDFDAFSSEIQYTLKVLIITKTNLSDVKSFYPLSQLLKLETLSLSSNKLKSIPSGAFLHVQPNLKKLSFQNNQIQFIGSNAFAGLINLKYLIISQNKLQSIGSNLFGLERRMTNLILLLEHNNLNDDSFNNTFHTRNRIVTLSLSNNYFTEISNELRPIIHPGGHVDMKNNILKCTCNSIWLISNSKYQDRCENCICRDSQDAFQFLTRNIEKHSC